LRQGTAIPIYRVQKSVMIQKATSKDAQTIAYFLFMAMEEIVYQFIGKKDKEMALKFLNHFTVKSDNQYSWQNCFIGKIDDEIITVANVYDGADLLRLRQQVIDFVKTNFNSKFNPESETQSGEMYLDCFAVSPNHRGQGFGSKLLTFLVEEFAGKQKQVLGLLVEKENFNAKKLYQKVGFTYVRDRN
jgi:ribosomal protein S18 acetylase RimI-like enzyme